MFHQLLFDPQKTQSLIGVKSLPLPFEKSVAIKDGAIYLPFEDKAYFVAISDTPVLLLFFARPWPRENSKIDEF